ncbi:MAG: PBP1A family penicillin-binding protein [Fibrobacteres bacterium]|nr:PBP1A family penicillin-binding protein [Fibrobacterota bacterium]
MALAHLKFSPRLYLTCLVALAIPTVLGLGAVGLLFWAYSKEVPPLEDLRSISPTLSTQVLDRDGKPFGEFFVERRNWVPLDSIPLQLQQAVMAIEDRQYYDHWGMNLYRTMGAAVNTVLKGRRQGGSTLTQQLAKNVFLTHEKSYKRKILEAITAVRLERYYTKRQLMTFYLNEIYLGSGTYGMQAAARLNFGKDVWKLDLVECATLAGMIQKPERYRPDKAKELVQKRRNTVLHSMAQVGYIDEAKASETMALPVKSIARKRANSDGAYFLEAVRGHIEKEWGEDALYHKGLVVHLPVDRRIQMAADSSVNRWTWDVQRQVNRRVVNKLKLGKRYKMTDSLASVKLDSLFRLYLDEEGKTTWKDSVETADNLEYYPVQAAVVLIENKTGQIRALVGGKNFENFKFNRATQSLRQAGSTFKPFVYGAAIEKGALPSDIVLDDTVAIDDGSGKVWTPHNYDNSYDGYVTLRRALLQSKNMPAVQTAIRYGVDGVVDLARRAGIRTPLPKVYSLALGSADVSLMEMTSAYSSFANLGVRYEPHLWDSINTQDGGLLERTAPKSSKVMDSANAYVLMDMMRDVVRRGTGYPVVSSGFTFPAGGKTGTTNDYTDAWFIAFTPIYTCGVWMGFDQKKKLGSGFTGGKVALPIWVDVMKAAHRAIPPVDWPRPSRVATYTACGKPRPDGTCAEMRMEFGVAGNPHMATPITDTASASKGPVTVTIPGMIAPTLRPKTSGDSTAPVRKAPSLF